MAGSGGPTETHALLLGSPATDLRGQLRLAPVVDITVAAGKAIRVSVPILHAPCSSYNQKA